MLHVIVFSKGQRKRKHCTKICAFLGVFAKLRTGTVNGVMFLHPSAWRTSAPIGRTFVKFDI